jgi:transcription initiation factor IIE alpha subunit
MELLQTELFDTQQQLRQLHDEMRQQIDNLNKQHAEALETERTTIRSNYDLVIEQLQGKHLQEIEQIRKG